MSETKRREHTFRNPILGDVHMVELKPGEIVISREQLREAWLKLCGSLKPDFVKHLERELFGSEP